VKKVQEFVLTVGKELGGGGPLLMAATFVINAGSAALELISQVFVNNAYKSSPYLTGNTLRLHNNAQPVNAV
jgi:hypothetical protein